MSSLRSLLSRSSSVFQAASHCAASTSGREGQACWAATLGLWQRQPHLQQPYQYQQQASYAKEQKKAKKKQGGGSSKGGSTQAASGDATTAQSTSFEDDQLPVERDAVQIVLQAIENVTPRLDVRTHRMATKVLYIPGIMPANKGRSLALHWLVRAAEQRHKSSRGKYAECLALEMLLAFQKRGAARQKRDDLHKLALQNRANLHMRWW